MVKQIIVLLATTFLSTISYCQKYEYNVENAMSEPSYYYTEARRLKDIYVNKIEETEKIEIRVLNSSYYNPVKCNIFFKGHETDSILTLSTDSNGYIYIPIKQMPNIQGYVDFEIKTVFNGLYNGIKGCFDIYKTRVVTIVLGKQGYEKISIESKEPIEPVRMVRLMDSLKHGNLPTEESGISTKIYIQM